MLSEISKIYKNARINLGGELWTHKITFSDSDWFLLGFKTKDKKPEDWTGFHSPNLMVVVTEASGIDQVTFDAIEGILTGNSRLVLIFNPNRTTGEAYQSTRSPLYEKFKLNCLNAVNVRAKKILIPGQVDFEWICTNVSVDLLDQNQNRIEDSNILTVSYTHLTLPTTPYV